MALSVATQINRQAANRLFSIRVSNFMAVLRKWAFETGVA